MALNDLLRVFWQRKLLIVLVALAVIVPAFVATKLVTKQYESTATLGVTPKSAGPEALTLFAILDQVVPFYAEAANSRTTLAAARARLGQRLGDISIETFKGTGLMKVKARSPSPRIAQLSAQTVAHVLVRRVNRGQVGTASYKLDVLDRASLPTAPVFPRTRLTLLVAALLGLGLGLAAALLRENLATKVETAEDLNAASGLPVFAEIPAETAVPKLHTADDLATQPRLHVVAEALRDLRTNLLFTDDSIRSIVVTSPDGSHGKTTVAFGLAATLSRAGARTVLVDCDLRRGRIAEMLGLPRTPGLMDVLLGETQLERVIRPTVDGPDVLVGGRRTGDPGELLTQEFPAVLAELEREYDAVVIDATPVIPISDARIVARFADATLLVARAGTASRRQVRHAVERLALISVKPTASVLNHSGGVSRSSYYVRPTEDPQSRSQRRLARKQRGAARS
ncbi:MAG TPA: polysaccharide biosynthesis tyrosine autokinase [Gaiellaceae bacterium]|nr:polysaccharide biosynthesis tyrosine autokinase [Gaiellaceae bacterium]